MVTKYVLGVLPSEIAIKAHVNCIAMKASNTLCIIFYARQALKVYSKTVCPAVK
jgi:hypothetical protein